MEQNKILSSVSVCVYVVVVVVVVVVEGVIVNSCSSKSVHYLVSFVLCFHFFLLFCSQVTMLINLSETGTISIQTHSHPSIYSVFFSISYYLSLCSTIVTDRCRHQFAMVVYISCVHSFLNKLAKNPLEFNSLVPCSATITSSNTTENRTLAN